MTVNPMVIRAGACALLAVALVGASLPRAMAGPGTWIVGKAINSRGDRVCLPDSALLMQWEHRTKACRRTVVTSGMERAEVQYSCAGGGFGTSRVQVLTPRSIKINTQGIADGLPFAYVIHARRIGDCAGAPGVR
jgi:hypothetical protein